ncbi:hypothetical protein M5K25_004730 [Dendrobium thyrsiflorum]|uniref:Uncharacterized protein n=1 Tax=Dendrobium thyrsiflorum TaxID=117978 RepID=A0ABD0VFM8_DENTH
MIALRRLAKDGKRNQTQAESLEIYGSKNSSLASLCFFQGSFNGLSFRANFGKADETEKPLQNLFHQPDEVEEHEILFHPPSADREPGIILLPLEAGREPRQNVGSLPSSPPFNRNFKRHSLPATSRKTCVVGIGRHRGRSLRSCHVKKGVHRSSKLHVLKLIEHIICSSMASRSCHSHLLRARSKDDDLDLGVVLSQPFQLLLHACLSSHLIFPVLKASADELLHDRTTNGLLLACNQFKLLMKRPYIRDLGSTIRIVFTYTAASEVLSFPKPRDEALGSFVSTTGERASATASEFRLRHFIEGAREERRPTPSRGDEGVCETRRGDTRDEGVRETSVRLGETNVHLLETRPGNCQLHFHRRLCETRSHTKFSLELFLAASKRSDSYQIGIRAPFLVPLTSKKVDVLEEWHDRAN